MERVVFWVLDQRPQDELPQQVGLANLCTFQGFSKISGYGEPHTTLCQSGSLGDLMPTARHCNLDKGIVALLSRPN